MIDESSLKARQEQVDKAFAAGKLRRDQLQAELDDQDLELHRLQGEYRLVKELLESPSDAEMAEPEQGVTEGELRNAPEPRQAKLHPVDKSGIPAEATVVGGDHGRS